MLREQIWALVEEGQGRWRLIQGRDVQAGLIGAVSVQWLLHWMLDPKVHTLIELQPQAAEGEVCNAFEIEYFLMHARTSHTASMHILRVWDA